MDSLDLKVQGSVLSPLAGTARGLHGIAARSRVISPAAAQSPGRCQRRERPGGRTRPA
jgi:hypothetical protein